MKQCTRCTKPQGWNNSVVTLIGGYHAQLCTDCRNAWQTYYRLLPEAQEQRRLTSQAGWYAARAAAGEVPTFEEIQQLDDAMQAVHDRLFVLGQQWVEAGTPQTEAVTRTITDAPHLPQAAATGAGRFPEPCATPEAPGGAGEGL